MANFFSKIISKINPFDDEPKGMEFKVGENLTQPQKVVARETIQKVIASPAPKTTGNFFADVVKDVKQNVSKVATVVKKLDQPKTSQMQQQGWSFPVETTEIMKQADKQASFEKFVDENKSGLGDVTPGEVGNFFADIAHIPTRTGLKIFKPTDEFTPDTLLERFLLGSETVKGISRQAADVELTLNDMGQKLSENENSPFKDFIGSVMQNKKISGFSGGALAVAGTFLDLYPGLPEKSLIEKQVAAFVTKRAAEGFAEKEIIRAVEKQFGKEVASKAATTIAKMNEPAVFAGFTDQSTKLLDELVGRKTVSKQFIKDSLNRPDVRKAEKEVFEKALAEYGDKIPVQDFANKVKTELLPLERTAPKYWHDGSLMDIGSDLKFEAVTLPPDARGEVNKYTEHVYESPIGTKAGNVHFAEADINNYFAHTRVEDMADNETRRVIELQSDLFQKGRLGDERATAETNALFKDLPERTAQANRDHAQELKKLVPYEDTWHERVIREEVKAAAQDGKTTLQFPTGETALKVEGLAGASGDWRHFDELHQTVRPATADSIREGDILVDRQGQKWRVTLAQGEGGEFAAAPESAFQRQLKNDYGGDVSAMKKAMEEEGWDWSDLGLDDELFNVGVGPAESHPIGKFYDGPVAKFVKKLDKDAKVITDDKGVKWLQMNVDKALGGKPVRTFGLENTAGLDFNLSQEEAVSKLRKLFDEDEMRFLIKNDLIKGKNAGMFSTKAPIALFSDISRPLIEVVQHEGKIADQVLYHESFHGYFNTFVEQKERDKILKNITDNYLTKISVALENKKAYQTPELRAEEWLANDFAKYIKGKEVKGEEFKGFYQRALEKVRGWIRKSSGAQKVYDDLINKVRPVHEAEAARQPAMREFNVETYVKEQTKAREAARGEELGVKDKLIGFYNDIKKKIIDTNAPIEDILRKAQIEGQFKILPRADYSNAIDRVYRAPVLAGQFAKDNGIVDVIKKVDDLDTLEQYMIAKHAQNLENLGINTGRNLADDALLIDEVKEKYEPFAQKVTAYSRKLLDLSVDSGLISRELADKLIETYPDYVPMNRVFEELENQGADFGSRAVASLSKQTVVKKIVGSEREIESPIASLLQKTTDAVTQAEKNKAASILSSYKDLPNNPLGIVPLRTYENVTERISLYSEAKELKPVQRRIETMVKRNEKELGVLNRELNKLNKAGLAESLRATDQPLDLTGRQTDVRKMIDQMITDPSTDLKAIKRKIATRENKLGPVIDDLEEARKMYDDVHEYRLGLIDDARLLADAKSKGLDVFNVLKNGVKEVYAAKPEVVAAAKHLDVQQLNIFERMLAFPVRVAKLGITGINLPFTGANIARDQVYAMVTSQRTLKTSLAHPGVFLDSLFNAAGHGEIYQDLIRAGAGGTSMDIARNQIPATVEKIRASTSIKSRIFYTAKHPSELFRAVEDIVGRGEELTRIQQFHGTRKALLSEGRTATDATIEAAKAARENTANFARHGEWGPVLNSAFLYLNAGIQGSRSLIRAFSRAPIETSLKVGLVFFTPLAAATAWNLSDPKRKQAYDDIESFEKDHNIIIVPPNPTQDDQGRWNVIKIPVTPGLANLGVPVRRTLEWAFGEQKPEVWADIAKPLTGVFSPVELDTGSIASTITPQAIRPGLEAYANKSFFTGKQQVPDSMKDLSPELQAKPYTSGTARKISGSLGVSPIKTEAFIKSTFGGVGSQFLNLTDAVLAGANVIPNTQVGGQNLIDGITARFTKAYGGAADDKNVQVIKSILTDQADESFKMKQTAEALWEEFKAMPKDDANAKARELKKVDPKLYAKLKDVADDDKKGLTYEDRLIKQIGVENGQRAKFIYAKLKEFDTKDEKNAYAKDLKAKGLISDQVWSQLKQLLKEGK